MMLSRHYKKRYQSFYYVVTFLALGMLSACRSEYCESNQGATETRLNIGFYTIVSVNGAPQEVSVTQRFRAIFAPGHDNLVANTDTIRQVRLRLPIAEDTATFILERSIAGDSIETDTIQLTTGRRLALTSQACDFGVQYGAMNIIQHTFDSLAVERATLDTSRAINVKIYY